MPMPASVLLLALDAALRGALVTALLLLAFGVARGHATSLLARAWIALALGLSIQTVAAAPEVELHVAALWQAPLVAVSVGNGVVFWVFTRMLFDDDFRPGRGHVLAWLAVAGASGLNCALGPDLGSTLHRMLELVQRATPLLCAVLVVVAAGSHWAADLIERRRSLRVYITVGGVIYSLVLLGLRLSSARGTLSPPLALFDTSLLLVIVAGVAARALVVQNPELLGPMTPTSAMSNAPTGATEDAVLPSAQGVADFSADPSPQPAKIDELEHALARRIGVRVAEERLYASADLTVASLAATLQVPEYRLRRSIHRALGFRNFNAFVNSFRLEEAKRALSDAQHRQLPILSIALNTGFRSIGPFNRAFKATFGLTPSEFREKYSAENSNHLAESLN